MSTNDPDSKPTRDAAELLAPVYTGEKPPRRRGSDYDEHGDRILHEPVDPVRRPDDEYARDDQAGVWEHVDEVLPTQGSPVGKPEGGSRKR